MMVAKDILTADLLDLLFADRNKQYGAYMLRKTYPKRLLTALVVTIVLGFSAMWLIQPAQTETPTTMLNVRDVVLENIEEVMPPPPPPPPKQETPPPPKKTTAIAAKPKLAPRVERTRFTPPVIKKDAEVKKSEMPPVKEIAVVDAVSTEGLNQEVLAAPPPVAQDLVSAPDGGTGIIAVKEVDENKIFEKVEIAASVNTSQWRRHLERNLLPYIEDAAAGGMEPGQYTVMVRFLVERDGSIKDVNALNNPGYGLGKGAEQVVKNGPKWSPGEQNGRKVRSYHTQPITFVIMGV